MGKDSAIEWTDHTFNIVWGCTKVSPACDNCYAEAWALRAGHELWGPDKPRRVLSDEHWRAPLAWNAAAERVGKPARVFCSSMADVFEDHPTVAAQRERLWPLIFRTPWLIWLLLTKRPENAARLVPVGWGNGWPANVWPGTTAEDQTRADERLEHLLALPANVHFASMEPLLAPVDIARYTRRLGWVIAGGESGPGARPMHPEWPREIREQCRADRVPFFFKQWGDFEPMIGADVYAEEVAAMQEIRSMTSGVRVIHHSGQVDTPAPPFRKWWQSWLDKHGDGCDELEDRAPVAMHRVGKKIAGRKLDGRTWDECPLERWAA